MLHLIVTIIASFWVTEIIGELNTFEVAFADDFV